MTIIAHLLPSRAGQIKQFTGIDSPYEAPEHPELVLDTSQQDVAASVRQLWRFLVATGVLERCQVGADFASAATQPGPVP